MALSFALGLAVRLVPRVVAKMGWKSSAAGLQAGWNQTYVVRFLFPFGCLSASPDGCDESCGAGVSDSLSNGRSKTSVWLVLWASSSCSSSWARSGTARESWGEGVEGVGARVSISVGGCRPK